MNQLLEHGDGIIKSILDVSGQVSSESGELGPYVLVTISFGTAQNGRALSRNESTSLNEYLRCETKIATAVRSAFRHIFYNYLFNVGKNVRTRDNIKKALT